MRALAGKALFAAITISMIGCVGDRDLELQEAISVQRTVEVNESSQKTVEVDSQVNDLNLKILQKIPSSAGELSLSGDDLVIRTNEIDRPGLISAILYSGREGPDHPTARQIDIAVRNTSAKGVEIKAESLLVNEFEILRLQEDYQAYKFILDIAYLNKLIEHDQKRLKLTGFKPESSPYHAETRFELGELDRVFDQYLQGNESDDVLKGQIDSTLESIANHGTYGHDQIYALRAYYGAFIPDFSNHAITYDPISQKASRYIGNLNLGSYQQGQWVFRSEYDLLNSLFRQR